MNNFISGEDIPIFVGMAEYVQIAIKNTENGYSNHGTMIMAEISKIERDLIRIHIVGNNPHTDIQTWIHKSQFFVKSIGHSADK